MECYLDCMTKSQQDIKAPHTDPVADPAAVRPPAGRPWKKLALLGGFVAVVVGLIASGAGDWLDFRTLSEHRARLEGWVAGNYAATVAVFMGVYALAVAFSVPGAVWLTIAGGFLFGIWATSVYVVVAATVGATAVFLLARYVFRDAWARRAGPAIRRMEAGFRDDALSYMLVLRLVPLFPFWLVNLVPAFLGVRLSTYVLATFLGIIPGAVVFASVGNGLEEVFARGGRPDLSIIWAPEVLGPLIGLAVLALVPVAWRRWKGRNRP